MNNDLRDKFYRVEQALEGRPSNDYLESEVLYCNKNSDILRRLNENEITVILDGLKSAVHSIFKDHFVELHLSFAPVVSNKIKYDRILEELFSKLLQVNKELEEKKLIGNRIQLSLTPNNCFIQIVSLRSMKGKSFRLKQLSFLSKESFSYSKVKASYDIYNFKYNLTLGKKAQELKTTNINNDTKRREDRHAL